MLQFDNKIIKFAILVIFNLAITITIITVIESVASLFVTKPSGYLTSDYRLNHKAIPNSEFLHTEWAHKDFPLPYKHYINKQGWLEKYDVSKKKAPDVFRIFYVGDSFVEGTCAMEKNVPSLMQGYLNQLAKGMKLSFEVINTGTSSYSPTIYYLLIRYVLLDYSPDLIVVNVDMTDVYDDWKYGYTLIKDKDGNPFACPPRNVFNFDFIDTRQGAVKATLWRKLQLFLYQRSNTYHLVQKYRDKLFPEKEGIPADLETFNPDPYKRFAWCLQNWDEETIKNVANSMDILKRLAILCKQRGIKVVFTSTPYYWQYAGESDGSGAPNHSRRPHIEVEKVAKETGISYLDSVSALEPYIKGTPVSKYYFPNDVHFNQRGYELWSKAQLQFLINKENSLLPPQFSAH
ncbi:MAG: SGNH/GDSL hydrolase family protein [Geobacteraceae bacterium]|nr:SGNH/GDSL hydrolase family protein [Geobacteraceae bacterium]